MYQEQIKPQAEGKVLGLLWVLYSVGKQVYKLELSKTWRIHNVFYLLLLEQKSTRKGRIDKNTAKLNVGNKSGEYKMEAI